MSSYKCPRCGYLSKQRTDLRRHFTRKKICQVIYDDISIEECFKTILLEENPNNTLECVGKALVSTSKSSSKVNVLESFKCKYCNKKFKHKRYLVQHQNRYGCGLKEINQKDEVIEKLKSKIEMLESSQNITNIQHTNNYTQNNIIINAFGNENLDYIEKDFVQKIVKEGPYASIQKLIKYIHFNPNHKENHNVKIPNKRDKYGMIYDGKKWQVSNKGNMIASLATHAYDVISDHCDDLHNKKFDKFKEDFETEEVNCMKRIQDDTEIIILNEQKNLGLI